MTSVFFLKTRGYIFTTQLYVFTFLFFLLKQWNHQTARKCLNMHPATLLNRKVKGNKRNFEFITLYILNLLTLLGINLDEVRHNTSCNELKKRD